MDPFGHDFISFGIGMDLVGFVFGLEKNPFQDIGDQEETFFAGKFFQAPAVSIAEKTRFDRRPKSFLFAADFLKSIGESETVDRKILIAQFIF